MLQRVLPAALLAGCLAGDAKPGKSNSPPIDTTRAIVKLPDSVARPRAPLMKTPDTLRGLYVNRWAAIGPPMWRLIDIAKTTEINAFVIDVKDDRGLMLYHSQVPLAREIGADTTYPMSYQRIRGILDSLRLYRIYPI